MLRKFNGLFKISSVALLLVIASCSQEKEQLDTSTIPVRGEKEAEL